MMEWGDEFGEECYSLLVRSFKWYFRDLDNNMKIQQEIIERFQVEEQFDKIFFFLVRLVWFQCG